MNRRVVDIDGGSVVSYGYYGRPLVAFPSENGEPFDWEDRGMVEAIAPLLDDGKVKLYCIPSFATAGRAATCRWRNALAATGTTTGGC